MKDLFVLCGAPGCGKSTFIKTHGYEDFTISSDAIRLMFEAPVYNEHGDRMISQRNDKLVWQTLYSLVEQRMKTGSVIFVDATHTGKNAFSKYRKLALRYSYCIHAIVFRVPVEQCLKNNKSRVAYKQVPDEVVEEHCERMEARVFPQWVDEIDSEDWKPLNTYNRKHFLSFDDYKDVVVIGDVHGCYHELIKHGLTDMKREVAYIFTGDYLDRGVENDKVMRFMLSICDLPNVFLLEGNHERHIASFAFGEKAISNEFERYTRAQLDALGLSKEKYKSFCSRLHPYLVASYRKNTFFICHGGVSDPCIFSDPFVPDEVFVKGTGSYDALDETIAAWHRNSNKGQYQIHGHRNIQRYSIKEGDRMFNLEGQVEFGGNLRVLSLNAI